MTDHTIPQTASANVSQTGSAEAFDRLLAQFRAMAPTERDKGNLFEALVAQYLRLDAQMAPQFDQVYLWRDWPGRGGQGDLGIDLVATLKDDPDQAVAVQCKFYDPGHRIQKSDLDSFLAESGKRPFVRRIFVSTTDVPWGKNAEAALEGQQIPVTRISLSDLRASNIDWSTYDLTAPDRAPGVQARKTPRDHQVDAIREVFEGFDAGHDRGTLVMACGTGKTFTALCIAEKTAEDNGDSARVLFMVPSLALMSQTLKEWSEQCRLPLTAWSVCSDSKVNKRKSSNDELEMVAADLKIPPTTNPAALAGSLIGERDKGGLQVVFATYQSIDIIHQAQEAAGQEWADFDLIICDEAHRTTGVTLAGEEESHFTRVHDSAYVRGSRRLYMTATPRLFNDQVKNVASEKDAVLTSMDDEAVFGPVFHRLGFGQAVQAGLLTDYKVVVLGIPEDQVSAIYQEQTADGGELDLPDTAKLVGCWNALAKRKAGTLDVSYGDDLAPMRRAVAFCKDIKTSKRVTSEFPPLVKDQLTDLTNDETSDDLVIECRHVDGTMNSTLRDENLDWLKQDTSQDGQVCRILTNARCLSEGVDVPSLDAVLFLNPRKSRVDVIQAVGRVMRKAPGKKFGYIILPVAVPTGSTPEASLDNNARYQVVWQVLQAIRAHDERFDATINSIQFNDKRPENIIVDFVDLTKPKDKPKDRNIIGPGGGPEPDLPDTPTPNPDPAPTFTQGAFVFPAEDWKDAVYAKIVKKVGSRLYWDGWAGKIADIATRYSALIRTLLDDQAHRADFDEFVTGLQATINPSIDQDQAVEMLAQHLITKPLFDAMFDDQDFTASNPVSKAMDAIFTRLASNAAFDNERRPLEAFYTSWADHVRAIDSLRGKQEIMRTLYDEFFSKAFSAMADRLGIVFTPVPVVDYIIYSANAALRTQFGKTLGDEDVSIIEPFVGTGTFIARLLQTGVIAPDQLEHKYKHELFANEVVLLSYYIASINIETVYREQRLKAGYPDEYTEFEGISLTDTFQLHENDDTAFSGQEGFEENSARARRQKQAPIRVIIMNPPYSAGQNSANDNNQNLKYDRLDARIAATYADKSTAVLKNKLYDSYYRALRWATDRIGDEGIIAFVANNSFIDSNVADGVRKTWQDEFSHIWIYNLRGGVRGKIKDAAKREGGNVFDIMTGVAIAVLMKTKDQHGPATIHYAEVDDYLARQEKLDILDREQSIENTEFATIEPNEHGDWINQRDDSYLTYQPIGDKKTKGKDTTPGIFYQYSLGLYTSRDAWCYNFSRTQVEANMRRMIDNYSHAVEAGAKPETVDRDPMRVSWSRELLRDLNNGKRYAFNSSRISSSIYRPFTREYAYFDRGLNSAVGQMPQMFPTTAHKNLAMTVEVDGRREVSFLMVNALPDLHVMTTTQVFSLFTWDKQTAPAEGELDLFGTQHGDEAANAGDLSTGRLDFSRPIGEQIPTVLDGYVRRDTITDATLATYRAHYGDESIMKEDIFFYVYALLHHPEYRERYEADLKKMLPRIPLCEGFADYARIGRELADLHVNYEQADPYPLNQEWSALTPDDDWARYKVTKPKWRKVGRKNTDRTTLVYNEYLTLTGVPEQEGAYLVGGRSPLDWVIDRYQFKTDKASQIVNDPNDYCREIGRPDYVVDLIARLVTVSLETQSLQAQLPAYKVSTAQQ